MAHISLNERAWRRLLVHQLFWLAMGVGCFVLGDLSVKVLGVGFMLYSGISNAADALAMMIAEQGEQLDRIEARLKANSN